MNLLLDTQVFLWWDGKVSALNPNAWALIEAADNSIFVSAASVWEIAVKRRLGKLAFSGPIVDAIGGNGFHELPILAIDCDEAGGLEWPHGDPFNRLLVAQAMRLGFALVTADRSIRAFGSVAQVWAA